MYVHKKCCLILLFITGYVMCTPIAAEDSTIEGNDTKATENTRAAMGSKSSELEDTLDLLKKGDEQIILNENHKNVILLLGMTGSGKSTFAQWFVGNISSLMAKEDGGGDFFVEDLNDKISVSTVTSKTVFPELIVENKTNVPFYDMPGFSDTRSTANDIATSYFIKKVIDHSERIKILICVNYPSVKKGVDRQDFMKMITHMTELVRNLDNYLESFAIVATKVDNTYRKVNGKLVLIDDEAVIESIGIFLDEAKAYLEALHNDKSDILYNNSIKLIEALTAKENGKYKRIAIFRRPDEPGPLAEIDLLKKARNHLETMIKNLQYSSSNNNDFGYTLSDRSKVVIEDLVEKINEDVLTNLKYLNEDVKLYYKTECEKMQNIIISLMSNYSATIKSDILEAQSFVKNMNISRSTLTKLAKDMKDISDLEIIIRNYNTSFRNLGININDSVLSNIDNQIKYLKFAKQASGKNFSADTNTLGWSSVFQITAANLAEMKTNISKLAGEAINIIEIKIANEIETAANSTMDGHIMTEQQTNDIQDIYEKMHKTYQIISIITEKTSNVTAFECMEEVAKGGLHITNNEIYVNHFDFLLMLSDQLANTANFGCWKPLDGLVQYLDTTDKWYRFLNRLFETMSSYEIQKDRKKCSALTYSINSKDEGKKVSETNLKQFLETCYNTNYNMEFDNIKNVKLDRIKITKLTEIFKYTLNYDIQINRVSGITTIQAPFVRMSDIIKVKNYVINVIALEKFFVDQNLNRPGQDFKLSIIAPVWETRGKKAIILNGDAGSSLNNKAVTGQMGNPGWPGNPGGSFLGVGITFIDPHDLTISVDGGSGGKGQDGSDGTTGKDGGGIYTDVDNDEGRKVEHCYDAVFKICNGTWDGVRFTSMTLPGVFVPSMLTFTFERDGERGTDGAAGGKGGYGGNPGKATFIYLDKDAGIRISSYKGWQGSDGTGGKGGLGGRTRMLRVTKKYKFLKYDTKTDETFLDHLRAESGLDGADGGNDRGIALPRSPNEFFKVKDIIDNGKQYVKHNLDGIRDAYLRKFIEKLDSVKT